MEVLWSRMGDELTTREVRSELPAYAYTTIATVLDRLARKGEVVRRPVGQVLVFTATGSGALHAARALRAALDSSDDPSAALRCLAEALTPEEVTAMRDALDRRSPS